MQNRRPEGLRRQIAAVFAAAGCSEEESAVIAAHLVESNLTGHDSHGLIRVSAYIRWMREGKVRAGQSVTRVQDGPCIAILDGNMGFGQTIGEQAVDIGVEKAKVTGIAAVTLRNVAHLGRIGDWAERAAAAGLASLHFVNTSGFAILTAPYGGSDRRLSADPISWGMPRRDGPPIVLDASGSIVAGGKIAVAHNKGVPMPDGCLLDHTGRPTNDTAVYYGPPLGAILPFGAHKGYGVSIFTELLAGTFSGGGSSHPDNPGADKLVNNMFSIYLQPEAFQPAAAVDADVARFTDWVKASPPLDPAKPVLLPGELEAEHRAARSAEGTPVDDATWAQFLAAAQSVGLSQAEVDALSN